MKIFSKHPELDQPLPRHFKMSSGFYVCTVGVTLAFLIPGWPIAAVILDQYQKNSLNMDLLLFYFLIMLLYLALISYALWGYYKEKKLLMWGSIAEARIVEGPDVNTGKGALSMLVNYGFDDANGDSFAGTRRFPARSDEADRSQEILSNLDHPIVLYDPKNSERNFLYPGYYVICCPPKNK